AVPAFMAQVPKLTAQQRLDTAALPFDQAAFYAGIGGSLYGDPTYTVRERLTLQPTIEINGIWGGYTGPGIKTVIPREAQAKITMRLVLGQDPDTAAWAHRVAAAAGGACPLQAGWLPQERVKGRWPTTPTPLGRPGGKGTH